MSLAIYLDKLKRDIEKSPFQKYAQMLTEKTNVPAEYFVVGAAGVLLLMVFFNIGANLICNLVGYAYPFYKSLKAIESKDPNDDTQWLTYWIVFGIFGFLEAFLSIVLYWIPFYFSAKLVFLVWCMYPDARYNGALMIYNHVLKDVLKKHEVHLDKALEQMNTSKILASTVAVAGDVYEAIATKKSPTASEGKEEK